MDRLPEKLQTAVEILLAFVALPTSIAVAVWQIMRFMRTRRTEGMQRGEILAFVVTALILGVSLFAVFQLIGQLSDGSSE